MKRKMVKKLLAGVLVLSCIMAPVSVPAQDVKTDTETTETTTEAVTEAETEVVTEAVTEAEAETQTADEAEPVQDEDEAFILTDDDENVTFKAGMTSDVKVLDVDQAQALIDGEKEALGGSPDSELVFESVLSAEHITIYNFIQELHGSVIANAVAKVVVGEDGTVFGLVSSLSNDVPEEYTEPINAEEAERIVREKVLGEGGKAPRILKDETIELLLPSDVILVASDAEENPEAEENSEAEVNPETKEEPAETESSEAESMVSVWAVYSQNDGKGVDARPYLVHYVKKDGTYLYSLPVYGPDSWEAENAVDHSAVYEGMTEETWTTIVTDYDGSAREITIPVMKDADGNTYLCSQEKRVVMADYYDYAIAPGDVPPTDDNITLLSDKEKDFSTEALLTYDYFLRIHDFFKSQGWDSPDGVGTDSLLLFNYCNAMGVPDENCVYLGERTGGWQAFAFSDGFGFGYCPDVMAHEFMHCITHATMLYSPYLNDYGAINEAMSDVVGKLTEQIILDKDYETWVMGGEAKPTRFMSDPHAGRQPEYVWDQYYISKTVSPCDINDNGGVHTNSSIMNSVAWRLHEAGMPMMDELNFWLAVNCCLSAKTDYPQLASMLPWVMEKIGYGEYLPVLTQAVKDVQMDRTTLPETMPEGCGMIQIPMPDAETFWNEDFKVIIMNGEGEVQDFYYPNPDYDSIVTVLPEGDYLAQIVYVNEDAQYSVMSYSSEGWIEGNINDENYETCLIEVPEDETVTLTNENLDTITLAPHDVFVEVLEKEAGGNADQSAPEQEWDTSIPYAVTPEQEELFDRAFEILMGVDYYPMAVLGTTQDSAGTIYCVLCKAIPVYPDAVPTNVLVYIHEDEKGNVTINNVWELWLDAHSRR